MIYHTAIAFLKTGVLDEKFLISPCGRNLFWFSAGRMASANKMMRSTFCSKQKQSGNRDGTQRPRATQHPE
jgi:hypothetical protein